MADRHIPVAASIDPAGAAPIVGTLRGQDVLSELSRAVRMTIASNPPKDDLFGQLQQQ